MPKHQKYVLILFWLFLAVNPLYTQVVQTHNIVTGFFQLKDQLNLGMVFSGAQLEYRYGIQWKISNHQILYQPRLGIGAAFNREMPGVQIHIAPVNVTWAMRFFEQKGHTIKGGLNFMGDYNYQAYPFLHDAHMFWNTEIGISPVVQYSFQWKNRRISAVMQNSLFGFVSHIQKYDPHYYSVEAKEFFVKPHKDLEFGSYNNYNRTNISLEFVPNVQKIHSFIYEFEYLGLFYGNKFERINHNVIWRMTL